MHKEDSFFKSILISLVTGLLIGLVVGLYQFILPVVSQFAIKVFNSREWWVITLNTISIILLSIVNYYLIKFSPTIDSSGIISINIALIKREEIPYKKEIPSMVANSIVSTYALFPLGSEGPSITLAGKIASGVNKIFKVKDEDNIRISFGAGFGAAFISPLSGFFYAFEEELHKVNFNLIIRTIITMLSMFLGIYFLHEHHALSVDNVQFLPIESSLILFIIFIFVIVVASIYLCFIKRIKIFYNNHENNFFIKNRGFILFILMLILGYLLTPIMGSGGSIISLSLTIKSVYYVFLILVFRIVITSIAGNGKVTGGLIVPSLAIGAMVGALVFNIFGTSLGLSQDYRSYIILLTMCMFFAYISEAPLTAITLFSSNLIYSLGSFDILNKSTLLGFTLIFVTYLVTRLLKVVPLYDMLVDISLNKQISKSYC